MFKKYFFPAAFLVALGACRHAAGPATRAPLEFKEEPKAAAVPAKDNVRIGLQVDAVEVSVTSKAPIAAYDAVSKKKETWPAGTHKFKVVKGVLQRDGDPEPGAWRLTSTELGGTLASGNYSYRGTLIVKAMGDATLVLINELDIDDYLKGVLPREAVPTWPAESLKVQAVASRTYLAAHLNRHADEGFDLCDKVHCQVYGGATKEHPATTAAVDATPNQILLYEGKPIGAFFSANCGGSTERIEVVWGTPDRPYLRAKKCRWGTDAPWYEWRLTIGDNDILRGLKTKNLVKGDDLKSISVTQKGGSGRAARMRVRTEQGSFDMLANDFRVALNPEKVRSTLFTKMVRLNGGYLFVGKGWGHGVGLCQWGAKGQAEEGRDYRDILAYYFDGATLGVWSRS